jgi:hypothetical protein
MALTKKLKKRAAMNSNNFDQTADELSNQLDADIDELISKVNVNKPPKRKIWNFLGGFLFGFLVGLAIIYILFNYF